jgi:hypothetical protein
MASLSIPLILALAAMGVDALLERKSSWLALTRIADDKQKNYFRFKLTWVVFLFMLIGLRSALIFSTEWMRVEDADPNKSLDQVVAQFKTQSTQWVQPPIGELFWLLPAMNANLKIADYFRPWFWADRERPKALLTGFRQQPLPEEGELIGTYDGLYFTRSPENEYAAIRTTTETIPCVAKSRGGNIDVDCISEKPGILIVRENSWAGWSAKIDGESSPLLLSSWLAVTTPEGEHHIEFRYRPWDVPVGLLLTIIGIVISVWLWIKNPNQTSESIDLASK